MVVVVVLGGDAVGFWTAKAALLLLSYHCATGTELLLLVEDLLMLFCAGGAEHFRACGHQAHGR